MVQRFVELYEPYFENVSKKDNELIYTWFFRIYIKFLNRWFRFNFEKKKNFNVLDALIVIKNYCLLNFVKSKLKIR